MRIRSTVAATLALCAFLTATAVASESWIRGTSHDFRAPEKGGPNTTYPLLAELAGDDACRVCHGSSPPNRDLVSRASAFEPQVRLLLPGAGICMGCHEGEIITPLGTEEMRNPRRIVSNKRHRRHLVAFPYPPRSGVDLSFVGQVVRDRGKVMVEGPTGVRLPLYIDPKTRETTAGCLTCHNHHVPGDSGYFLRTNTVQELCHTCHASRR